MLSVGDSARVQLFNVCSVSKSWGATNLWLPRLPFSVGSTSLQWQYSVNHHLFQHHKHHGDFLHHVCCSTNFTLLPVQKKDVCKSAELVDHKTFSSSHSLQGPHLSRGRRYHSVHRTAKSIICIRSTIIIFISSIICTCVSLLEGRSNRRSNRRRL